jgi:plastocyanin
MKKDMSTSHSHLAKIVLALLASGILGYGGGISGKINGGKGAAVVYIDAIPGKTFLPPDNHIAMDQKSLQFQPHAIVILAGSTVDFRNSDTVQHNIFWPSVSGNKKLSHNMGIWPQGEIRSFKFNTPGIVSLLCDIHPEMFAYVIVAPTPYYAEADATGTYKIEDIPDGSYTVTAWREGMKSQSKTIAVAGIATLDWTLTK